MWTGSIRYSTERALLKNNNAWTVRKKRKRFWKYRKKLIDAAYRVYVRVQNTRRDPAESRGNIYRRRGSRDRYTHTRARTYVIAIYRSSPARISVESFSKHRRNVLGPGVGWGLEEERWRRIRFYARDGRDKSSNARVFVENIRDGLARLRDYPLRVRLGYVTDENRPLIRLTGRAAR